MAQNYNLKSAFGFNVSTKGEGHINVQQTKKQVLDTNTIFDKMTDYVAKYEDVFTGDVEKEINMYSRQAMIVGMNLKAADTNRRKFDMSI